MPRIGMQPRLLFWSLALMAAVVLPAVPVAAEPRSQAAPQITLSPSAGPALTPIMVRGDGFVPGDIVLVEIVGASGETRRLATVTVDGTGTFAVSVTLATPTDDLSRLRLPIDVTLMGFPRSFAERSSATVAQAPKATFTVTGPGAPPVALPRTGAGPALDPGITPSLVMALAMLGCLSLLAVALRWHGAARYQS
jgi:hypothetical protein